MEARAAAAGGRTSPMLSVIIVIHLMLVIAMIGVVLLQKSEGGGLVSSTSGFMTGRGTANVLSRTTALLAAGFFVTSLALSWLASSSASRPRSSIPAAAPAQEPRARRRQRRSAQAVAAYSTSCAKAPPGNPPHRPRPRADRKCRSRIRRTRYPSKAAVNGPRAGPSASPEDFVATHAIELVFRRPRAVSMRGRYSGKSLVESPGAR